MDNKNKVLQFLIVGFSIRGFDYFFLEGFKIENVLLISMCIVFAT